MAWIIPLVIVVLLLLPAPIAERYTSPTQDGQYAANPVKAYRFMLTLAGVADSAVLGNSGKALARAKEVFAAYSGPLVVELLYLGDRDDYLYVTREGRRLSVPAPPKLVWEVWGRDSVGVVPAALDVIGFLDYESGQPVGGPSMGLIE